MEFVDQDGVMASVLKECVTFGTQRTFTVLFSRLTTFKKYKEWQDTLMYCELYRCAVYNTDFEKDRIQRTRDDDDDGDELAPVTPSFLENVFAADHAFNMDNVFMYTTFCVYNCAIRNTIKYPFIAKYLARARVITETSSCATCKKTAPVDQLPFIAERVHALIIADKTCVPMTRCGRCRDPRRLYCSKACRAHDWLRRHKVECTVRTWCSVCFLIASEAGLAKLSVCSRCTARNYCSLACQKADWATHKRACK